MSSIVNEKNKNRLFVLKEEDFVDDLGKCEVYKTTLITVCKQTAVLGSNLSRAWWWVMSPFYDICCFRCATH